MGLKRIEIDISALSLRGLTPAQQQQVREALLRDLPARLRQAGGPAAAGDPGAGAEGQAAAVERHLGAAVKARLR